MTTTNTAAAGWRAAAADLLFTSRRSGGNFSGFPEDLKPHDENDAYAIQRELHRLFESGGSGQQVGWKIGCTSPVMQELLGIDHPCAGGIFEANAWRDHHVFDFETPRKLGVECEIAVRIGKGLPKQEHPYELAQVIGAVGTCMAAIEVVEDRYVDFHFLDSMTLIADDFFQHSVVLGEEFAGFDPRRLRDVQAKMVINGKERGKGTGSDLLGEPLSVLCWLANYSAQWNTPLQSGDVVLLGSMVQVQWVHHGDSVAISNDLLGEVQADFSARSQSALSAPAPDTIQAVLNGHRWPRALHDE